MKIRVISLQSSIRRRSSIAEQFEALDAPFEFFDAITPENSVDHIDGYDEHEFFLNCGRAATATEIACYASHLALWRQCASDDEPYLILEDDAKLDETFLAGLLVARSQVNQLGIIRISMREPPTSVAVRQLGPFELHFCRRVPLLALGYAVSPRAARKLLEHGSTIEEPVDKYLQRFWRFGQPVFAIVPPVVRLTEHYEKSDIGDRSRPRQTPYSWLRRAVRKTQNSVARTLFSAGYLAGPAHDLYGIYARRK